MTVDTIVTAQAAAIASDADKVIAASRGVEVAAVGDVTAAEVKFTTDENHDKSYIEEHQVEFICAGILAVAVIFAAVVWALG